MLALALTLDLDLVMDQAMDQALAMAFTLAMDQAPALDQAMAIVLALDLGMHLAQAMDLALVLAMAMDLDLDLVMDQAMDQAPALDQAMAIGFWIERTEMKKEKLYAAYRDGIEMYAKGESFLAPQSDAVVEILYDNDGNKSFFVELVGEPACAHGDTVANAISEARLKRDENKPLTDEEKQNYRAEDFKFSPLLFRRITKACAFGIKQWLKERDMDMTVTMTIKEFRAAGGGAWADTLEDKLK